MMMNALKVNGVIIHKIIILLLSIRIFIFIMNDFSVSIHGQTCKMRRIIYNRYQKAFIVGLLICASF